MKDNTIKTAINTALCLVAACATVVAQSTWTGLGADDNWNTPENWSGDTVPANDSILYFGEADSYTVDRNIGTDTSPIPHQIIFQKGAGEYEFIGDRIRLNTSTIRIDNFSGETQTFKSGLRFNAGGVINTAHGDIIVENGYNTTGNPFFLPVKEGTGTLTVKGDSGNITGHISVKAGTLVLEQPETVGIAGNNTTFETKNNAELVYVGANSGVTSFSRTDLRINVGVGAAAQLRLDANGGAGIQASFTGQFYWYGGTGTAADQGGTFNLDLSSHPDNSVTVATLNANAALSGSGIWGWATVTDSSGLTGFGTRDGANKIVRFQNAAMTVFDGGAATASSTNYLVNADAILSANRSTGGVTIAVANEGEMSGGNLTTEGILMQEGSKSYTIKNAVLPQTSRRLFIHQYSMDGDLILDGLIHNTDTGAGGFFAKAGPGTVVIGENGVLQTPKPTVVQEGKLVLDGKIERSVSVRVFDGATLEGSGEIGTEAPSAVQIYAGGKLAGSTENALEISGTLALDSYSTFAFTLGTGTDSVNISGAITLQDDVNLSLALTSAPDLYTNIYLLQSGDDINGITGNFVYNNTIMTHGTAFTLGGYNFTYYQDNQNIWVQAIPEPSAALLFGLGTALLLLRRRR